jgi:adenylate cyclase
MSRRGGPVAAADGGEAGPAALPPSPDRRRARRTALALGLGSALVVLVPWSAGWLQPVEGVAMGLAMRLRGPRPPQPDVVVVAIDEASVDRLGRWPWPRHCVGSILDAAAAAGARTLALDVVFSEPTRSPPGADLAWQDAALADSMGRAGNVVGGFFLRSRGEAPAADAGAGGAAAELPAACAAPPARLADPVSGWLPVTGGPYALKTAVAAEPNLEMFDAASAAQGFFSHQRDEGVQQHYDLVTRLAAGDGDAGDAAPALAYPALALAAVAEQRGVAAAVVRGQGDVPVVELGGEPVATDEELRLWIDYAGPAGTYPALPAWELLARPAAELAPRLAGKLVFVGATETGIGDLASTPFGEMPGVEVHANAAGNLLSGRYIRDGAVQVGVSLAALFGLALLVAALVHSVERHLVGSLLAIAAVLLWPAACFAAFAAAGWHLHAVPPVLAGTVALVTTLRYQVGTVEARARRIKGLFRRYVSPEVVEDLLRRPAVELGGEKRDMTVLFSDIRGFTDMSEHLDSTEVVALLNEFFTPMTRLVLERGGTLDKYMGDAMMAFFGAPLEQPDHAARAAAAALAMRAELVRLNRGWRERGRLAADKAIGIGIGLNSGVMTVGNMGSDDVFDYTVIGDAVNLGSRIEGLNKVYGTELLVSGDTAARVADAFVLRELDRVRVKGKSEAVVLCELMAARPDAAAEDLAARFAAAVALYRGRDFAAAEAAFAALAADGDGPSRLYVERSRRHRAEPPPDDWDAVETFTSK